MLPENLQVKIDALKKHQMELLCEEVEFHKQVHAMEVDFQKKLSEMYNRRRQIIEGSYVPQEDELAKSQDGDGKATEQVKGIPEFWLGVFKMTPVLRTMMSPKDEAALKHLVDVRSVMVDDPKTGFVLEFEFEPNEFFSNQILTKQYLMQCIPNPEKPSSFNGFEIYDAIGCEIDWKQDANLTVVSEMGFESMANSFFNFFNPKQLFEKLHNPLLSKECMETDFEIGFYIKERVVPRAVMFYIGEYVCLESESLEEEDCESLTAELAELSA